MGGMPRVRHGSASSSSGTAGGVRLTPEMMSLARSIDAGAGGGGGGGEDGGSGANELVARVEERAVHELSCYVRACMMRMGFA